VNMFVVPYVQQKSSGLPEQEVT